MSNYQLSPQFKMFFNKLAIYALMAYIFFILGKSVWINWYLGREIDRLKSDISEIQKQNKDLENLILYYQSDSFKEVEARQKLGLKKPGEKVMAVPVKKYDNFQEETATDQANIAAKENQENTPHYLLWWAYFFQ